MDGIFHPQRLLVLQKGLGRVGHEAAFDHALSHFKAHQDEAQLKDRELLSL